MELSALQLQLVRAILEYGDYCLLELLARGSYLPNLDKLRR